MSVHDPLLARIAGEFHEMPGLRLTLGQAARFWQLERSVCEAALHTLVQRDVLYRTMDGYYIGHPQARTRKAPFTTRES
jgi:hypothetical protein